MFTNATVNNWQLNWLKVLNHLSGHPLWRDGEHCFQPSLFIFDKEITGFQKHRLILSEQRRVRTRFTDNDCQHDRFNRHVKILKLSSHAAAAALISTIAHMHTLTCAHLSTHPSKIHPSLWSRAVIYIRQKSKYSDILKIWRKHDK